MASKTVTVAVAQLELTTSVKNDVEKIKNLIKIAKGKNADIVVFPETSLKGEPIDINDPIIKGIFSQCKKSSIWCIIGDYIKEKKHTYNTMLLIDRKGNIFGKQRKVFICEDNPSIKEGSSFKVFSTELGKIGIAICWDISYSNSLSSMAKKKVDIIFCPMFWCYDKWAHKNNPLIKEKKILQSLLLTRAYENLVYVIFCSPIFKKNKTLVSYSAIAEPHKIMREIFKKEGMIIAKLNISKLHELRKRYKKDYRKQLF